MAAMTGAGVIICLTVLVSVCSAGEFCYSSSYSYGYSRTSTYCMYGCCGYADTECCSGPVGLIVGLCVGGAVFLFFIILTICLCRRRRYGGIVYRSQPAGTVVVQQSNMTNQTGVVGTAGVQPGVTYPPYPQYQYPTATYPAAPTAPSGYYPGYQAGAGYPPQPMPYAAEPPKYDTLNFEAGGGIGNRGFDVKN